MAEAKRNVKKIVKKEAITAKAEKGKVKNGVNKKVDSTTNAADTQAEVKTAAKADESSKEPLAKAGRRSAKALKEAEEKEAKEERKIKTKEETSQEKPRRSQKPPRSRLERRSRNYRKVAEQIDRTKLYPLAEAVGLAIKTTPVQFDATVEMHVNLSVDPRQADQNIRGNLVLPSGTGKTVRVAVFAEGDGVEAAKKAGADITSAEEVTKLLDKETLEFDVLIAAPATMARLGKYARLLGPRGLMPNPKSGTVTTDVAKAVKEAKAGRIEYRVDSTGIVHLGIGKVSFGADKVLDNAKAVVANLRAAKPASIKGTYIKSIHVTTTMGPSIPVNPSETS